MTCFLVPNGIAIELADGSIHKFVVSKRDEWVGAIDDARIKYAAAQPVAPADAASPRR